MNTRNCPNCAAPYDISLNKCPYCGTSYYDMSALDFSYGEPFYLKIRYNGMCITQFVRPRADVSFEFTTDTVDYVGRNGKIASFTTGHSVITNLEFEAVSQSDKELIIIEIENKES